MGKKEEDKGRRLNLETAKKGEIRKLRTHSEMGQPSHVWKRYIHPQGGRWVQNKSEQKEWGCTIYRRKNESGRTGRGAERAKPPIELRSVKMVKSEFPWNVGMGKLACSDVGDICVWDIYLRRAGDVFRENSR